MMSNQQTLEVFSKTYSQLTNDRLLGLYLERDELPPEAHSALLAELQKRSLTESAAALAEQRPAVESTRKSSAGEEGDLFGAVFGRR